MNGVNRAELFHIFLVVVVCNMGTEGEQGHDCTGMAHQW